MRIRKSILCSLLLLGVVFTGCAAKENGKDNVVIYSSAEDYRNEEMEQQLNERFPQYNIVVEYYSTGNLAAKLKAEGVKTEADIIIGLETASIKRVKENLADLSNFPTDHYEAGINDDDMRYLTWEMAVGSIIVNTNVLKEKGLEEPRRYGDLLKPEYKNLIVMPNPKTSNTGYMFLNTWANMWGEEDAFKYVDSLQNNIKTFTESGAGPVNMLMRGEAAIGIGIAYQAVKQISEGNPLKIVQLEEGCPYNTTSSGIIKGREERMEVKEVFEFLITTFNRYDKENFVPGNVLKNQEIRLENYPMDIRYSDMRTISDDEYKEALISKWKY